MVMANTERITRGLNLLRDGLGPKCAETWQGFYGDDWLDQVNAKLHNPEDDPSANDVAFLFKGMKATWNEVFGHGFAKEVRDLVFELARVRNKWAHQEAFSTDDATRALDSMERLLEAFGCPDERQEVKTLRRDLMRQLFEEESRAQRRKKAAKPTEGEPQAGLIPWREIISPHTDVASGQLDQAEFAADLSEVAKGTADEEYQDPKAFFARTFLTEGLKALLTGATRRLSGGGGNPVIELQTNFGGGKTHSLIALYHLASGLEAEEMPGVSDLLAEEGLELPGDVNRAVIVGQMVSPSSPNRVEEGVELRTLWGHLAYQLGGKEGYETVRTDDENGTNPGEALKALFEEYGPAVVLIDEWIAYARQLRDEDEGGRLAGGDFATQFTFAQALTEAAAAVDNVVILVSIPQSRIEVGGDRGKIALEELKNVVGRNAAQWQPAGPYESFEIVKRRLFDPIAEDQVRARDGVIGAFCEMYRNQPGAFPSVTAEAEYRKRMEATYPIHPELFDRLFGEWSSLDKFQRTRGVLRLMALAISRLWQRGDQSLLIMPGNLPMDSGSVVSELQKYLEEAWDPIIKSDVDGENALPLRIDNDNKHFGRISATRRAARTVYMGSVAKPEASQGIDIKSVVLGCAQPGEPVDQFADALKRLSGQATHLYVDGSQYWYSLQPNVTRLAADRAASNFDDRDADGLVKARITTQRDRGSFSAMQVFAEGPGDVPDDDDGVRLVVLAPDATHSANDDNSPAIGLAGQILAQRDGGPRLNKNLLVFVASAANRLDELRKAARAHLAWKSIVDEHEALDLSAHQKKQAETKVADTAQQVGSLIAETFTQVITPIQEPGSGDLNWQTTRAAAAGDIGVRVSKKLATEEKLIATYGGVRVKMDVDRYGLWTERHDIEVGELWNTYARFLHMPRVASFQTLAAAISDGTANMNWEQETFGYADAHDGEKWVGVLTGAHLVPNRSGLLIHPDHVPDPTGGTGEDDGGGDDDGGGENGGTGGTGGGETGEAATRFYAQFRLDSVRAIRQLGEILEDVTSRLGPDLEIDLEVQATNEDGYDEATRRIVSENARHHGAKGAEFE